MDVLDNANVEMIQEFIGSDKFEYGRMAIATSKDINNCWEIRVTFKPEGGTRQVLSVLCGTYAMALQHMAIKVAEYITKENLKTAAKEYLTNGD